MPKRNVGVHQVAGVEAAIILSSSQYILNVER